jgi:hypothetical protein
LGDGLRGLGGRGSTLQDEEVGVVGGQQASRFFERLCCMDVQARPRGLFDSRIPLGSEGKNDRAHGDNHC